MMLDGHIHVGEGPPHPKDLVGRLGSAGFDGGILISQPPASFDGALSAPGPAERLENLVSWCEAEARLYPIYWIDPVDTDALQQVDLALSKDVAGFKIICDHFYPGDTRALRVYRAIAEADKPILFHSGILWDGKPSSDFCRPVNFEALLAVDGLRFALAHISWPWVDECIALYGKIGSARREDSGASIEMFIDTTPGTPPIYRRDALTKLFTVGYDVAQNVFFGSDGTANAYGGDYAQQWISRDRAILADIGVDAATQAGIFAGNLERFLGV